MTFRTLVVMKAVVCLVFGIALLLAPGLLLGLLGAELNDGGRFTAREYGAALIGTLLLTWFARNVQGADARGAILIDLLVYDAIGMIVTFLVVLSGVLNVLAWVIVVVYLFFAVGSASLLLKERPFGQGHAPGKA